MNALAGSPARMQRSPGQIQKSVIYALIMRELLTRFGGRMLGLFWVLFEPAANIVVLLMIRVVLRERYAGVQVDPAVFLIVAMIPFFAFRNIWMRAMSTMAGNLGLFAYRQVKPLDAVVARTLVEVVMYLMIFLVLIGGIWWYGTELAWPYRPLEYIGIVCAFIMWGVGMGLLTAIAAHRRPAVETFVRLSSMPLYMLSGVLVPLKSFPLSMHDYLLWNPILHLVELSRAAYFPSYHVYMGTSLSYPLWTGLGVFTAGMVAYRLSWRKLVSR